MELLHNLGLGFSQALSLANLFYCFVGALLGTAIGVLPGLGPVATIAMLLPITYQIADPTSALIMLAGIYYGAQYGGSTTAILVNMPGEVSSVVTTLDGYQMARKGRAGAALAIAALGSLFAGSVSTMLIAAAAMPMTSLALKFGPAEYFALMVLGLIAAVVLAHGTVVKALGMVAIGLLIGMVGTDVNSGVARFSFGITELTDGVELAAIAIGMFGFSEIMANVEQREHREVFTKNIGRLLPTWEEFKASIMPSVRGTALGSLLGVLPGGGAALSSFSSYALEKKLSKTPEEFGKGAVAGVAGPESANNAGAQTSFIPMLTLGIPSNAVMALMIAAMMIHDIQPGPQVMTSRPALFWGLIASMWVGNLILVLLNLPLIGIWVKMLTVPYRMLYPAILLFCVIGAYTMNNNAFDIWMTIPFAIIGYGLKKLDCEPAPMLLGIVLGPLMEENLRRAIFLFRGDWFAFFTRPLSGTLLGIALILLVLVSLPALRRKRDEAFSEEEG